MKRGGSRDPGCRSASAKPPRVQAPWHLSALSPSARPPAALGVVPHGDRVAAAWQILSSMFLLEVIKKGRGKGYLLTETYLLIQARASSSGASAYILAARTELSRLAWQPERCIVLTV